MIKYAVVLASVLALGCGGNVECSESFSIQDSEWTVTLAEQQPECEAAFVGGLIAHPSVQFMDSSRPDSTCDDFFPGLQLGNSSGEGNGALFRGSIISETELEGTVRSLCHPEGLAVQMQATLTRR